MRDFIAAAVQMNSTDSVAHNLKEAKRLVEMAVRDGAQLVLLPENFAFLTRNEREKLEVAEPFRQGPIQAFLAEMAARLGIYLVGGSVPLKSSASEKVQAACLIYNPKGELIGRYDKIHLFDVELPTGERYRESATIESGSAPLLVKTPLAKLGVAICYDSRFPELIRQLSQEGMEVLLVPAAFTVPTGKAHWEVLLRARAIENQCYCIAAAEWGRHPGGRETYGHSMIVDPWGEVLACLEEGVGVCLHELSAGRLEEIRQRFPALKHRKL